MQREEQEVFSPQVRGTFKDVFALQNFPFDIQVLNVLFEVRLNRVRLSNRKMKMISETIEAEDESGENKKLGRGIVTAAEEHAKVHEEAWRKEVGQEVVDRRIRTFLP